MIYFDHNATYPSLKSATDMMLKVMSQASGNPSSLHESGRKARKYLDDARDKLAQFLHVESGSIVFTSGGTEANNMAIWGYLSTQPVGHVITTAIEHPAVLENLEIWKQQGWDISTVRPDNQGYVDPAKIEAKITAETRMVCVMAANNETGVLQDIEKIGAICKKNNICFFVDAVQQLGKEAIDIGTWQADMISVSAHKIGGPKGVGALIIRRGLKLKPLTAGGGQERKRRSGTENVPAIAGFAAALGEVDFTALKPLRDHFEAQLKANISDAIVFSSQAKRVSNTSMFCIPRIDGETLLMQLDLAGFAVASGSACSSGKRDPSHVLQAMGYKNSIAGSSIRVSFGHQNTEAEADALVDALINIRQRLAAMAGHTWRNA
ncbi:MAG: cysteine desulfurase family protein [Mariprofundaceae bacterium]|nr:cysteine desulfurase family protein [Mariprofundaceae bacterium]